MPDVITVRKQLEYTGVISFSGSRDRIVKWWDAAKTLIDEWECEEIEDYEAFDLDKSTNPEHARIIGWAATIVWQHMITLKDVPKN